MPHHLRPTAAIAPVALLPGDPGRALALAQDLLERPLMANHAHGLWGYSATDARGAQLTIQATGIGGPSLAIVVTELAELGVRTAIRLGTCRALRDELEPGELIAASAAEGCDGASRALGAFGRIEPDAGLLRSLLRDGQAKPLQVVTIDLHHDAAAARRDQERIEAGAGAVDLATATLLALGARLGLRVAALLVVVEARDGRRAADEELAAASLGAGRLGALALAEAQAPVSGTSSGP